MAGTTQTLTNAGPSYQPRAAHTGLQVATQSYQYNGSTMSASDVLLMVKIPRHAKIMDWYINGNGGATTTVFKVGIQGVSDTALAATITLSATDALKRAGNGDSLVTALPYTVTASDSNVNQFKIVQLLATTVSSATNTGSFTLAVFYAMDGSN
jgi:hypothetical protein